MENCQSLNDIVDDVSSTDDIKILESKYNQIMIDVASARKKLSCLREKDELLPYSNYKKIKIFTGIIALITFIILSNLGINLIIHLMCFLKSYFLFTDLQIIIGRILLIAIILPLITVIDVRVFKRMLKNVQSKSYQRIINSDEYKQILMDIKVVSEELDEKLSEEKKITKELFALKSRYAITNAERNIRNTLSVYNNDCNIKNKPYTRRLVKNTRRLVKNDNNFK